MFCLCTGCSTHPELVNRLEKAENIIDTYPDSALHILEEPIFSDIRNRKEKALHSLLYSKALDKNYIDICSDSIIRPAADYYSKYGNNLRRAQSLYYLGTTFYNANDIKNAAENYLKAKEAADKTDEHYLKGQICNILGLIYYRQDLFIEAAALYEESGKHFNCAGYPEKYANALSYAAKSCYLHGDDSTAISHYSRASKIYTLLGDTSKITSCTLGIANLLLENNQADSTIKILDNCYKIYLNGNIPLQHFPIWSKIYYIKNDYPNSILYAKIYLDRAFNLNDDIISGIFKILNKSEYARKNYKEALFWNEKYIEVKNRLYIEKSKNHIKEIEARYTKEHLAKAYKDLQKKHNRHKATTILIISVLACSIAIFAAFAKRKIQSLKARKNLEIEFYKALVHTLKEHHNELENRLSAIHANNSGADGELFMKAYGKRVDALKELMDYAYISESSPEKFYRKFREYLTRCSKDDSSFNDLQFIANKRHHGIIDYLKEAYPNLNQTDLNYCSMICLGFTTNAIRIMYGHTNSTSIYNRRSRLHAKLNAGNLHLETFLSKLMSDLAQKEA